MTAVDAPMTTPPLSDGSRPSMSLKRQSLTNGGGLAAPVADADAMSVNSMVDVEARCGGCRKLIDQENGGIVVQFGTSYWHVDCFRCAKCQQQVSADTNLLLLSDGSPVCGNCSYQCFVCKQSITEEAIMTGDESYHAHCFTCRTCKRRIEELVFAKTTQGIYCMSCHNERVARSRRHAEAKRQRAARKEREREEAEARKREGSGTLSHSTTSTSLNVLSNLTKSPTDSSPANSPVSIKGPDRKSSLPPLSPNQQQSPRNTPEHRPRELSVDRSMGASSPTARAPSPSTSRMGTSTADHSMPSSPALEGPSWDASTRATSTPSPRPQSPASGLNVTSVPLQASQASPSVPNLMSPSPRNVTPRNGGSPALGVPSTRSERRRSINPGLMFNMDAQNATFAAEPRAPSPLRGSDVSNSTSATPASMTPAAVGASAPGESKDASLSVLRPPSAPHTPQIRSRSTTPVGDEKDKERKASVSAIATTELAEKGAEGEPGTMPRIDAPNLPTMSFSLSDPDFAMLLKSPGQGQNAKPPTASTQEVEKAPRPNGIDVSPNHLSPKDGGGLPPAGTLRRRGSVDSFISVRLAPDSAFSLLKECMSETKGDKVTVDREILNDLVREYQSLRDAALTLKTKYTGAKRSSQQYSEGLTIAGEEYDKEVAARRDLEAENIRLRAQVHSQTARLSVISSDERRAENMRRRSQDLASSLSTLERDISRLRAQRDISLAEMEELQTKSLSGNAEETASKLGRSLTRRLDTIKEQYKDELGPLSAQREVLQREINDLRDMREHFLEESTSLAAKNEEIAELNTQLSRQMEVMQDALARRSPVYTTIKTGPPPPGQPRLPSHSSHPSGSPSMSSLTTTLQEVPEETAATVRVVKVSKPEMEAAPARRFKWMGKSTPKTPEVSNPKPQDGGRDRKFRPSTEMGMRDHHFQQHSTMRLGRCELCQDKMWGLQEVKCAACGVVCHSKCADKLPKSCPGKTEGDDGPLPPTMFGRDLSEQAAADGVPVPVIVTKCIGAVEANGMEYEGIYRKTGGSSQSKQITQLFEKGRYDTFDLNNVEAFNDISSITSVLKTYFRQLPDPLMTHALHESFVAAANIRDANNKSKALTALLKELPRHHYDTLKVLMLHLNRVTAQSSSNLMTSQNLGVVFGPTLLRSKDPGREFGDMAGKALSVQWMVDNAPTVFLEEEREPRANGE